MTGPGLSGKPYPAPVRAVVEHDRRPYGVSILVFVVSGLGIAAVRRRGGPHPPGSILGSRRVRKLPRDVLAAVVGLLGAERGAVTGGERPSPPIRRPIVTVYPQLSNLTIAFASSSLVIIPRKGKKIEIAKFSKMS